MYISLVTKIISPLYVACRDSLLEAGSTTVDSLGYGTIDVRLDDGFTFRLNNVHHIPRDPTFSLGDDLKLLVSAYPGRVIQIK